jgi:hypothetical protein
VLAFLDRDTGVEWIEEQLLEQSALTRRKWLKFEPLRMLHGLFVLKSKYKPSSF